MVKYNIILFKILLERFSEDISKALFLDARVDKTWLGDNSNIVNSFSSKEYLVEDIRNAKKGDKIKIDDNEELKEKKE